MLKKRGHTEGDSHDRHAARKNEARTHRHAARKNADSISATAQVIPNEEVAKIISEDPANKPVTDPNLIQAMKSMVDDTSSKHGG